VKEISLKWNKTVYKFVCVFICFVRGWGSIALIRF
jgi:hypothetical protein